MKVRRWVACFFALLMLVSVNAAMAAIPVALDDLGIHYTPLEDETLITRTAMPQAALDALGVDAQTLQGAMTADGVYLISIGSDGQQFSLLVTQKPSGVTAADASGMTAADKEAFLTQLARQGGYGSATWQDGGYALFSASVAEQLDGALPYSTLMVATLYLNQTYALRMDVIGRETTANDVTLLLSAASRLLRLGARGTASQEDQGVETLLSLPTMQVSSAAAELTYLQQDLPLTLEPIADTIGVTQFTLTGSTVPDGYLRFSLGEKTSSRVKADANGAFSFTIPGLTGNEANLITLTAFKGEQMTVVTFTVTVDWQLTPLVLSPMTTTQEKTVTLTGLTLPGSTVKLTQGRGSSRIFVAEDGSFTITLILGRLGDNDFTLQAQATGYRRNDHTLTLTREASTQETLENLQKKAKPIPYESLTAKPQTYADRVVQLSGIASGLAYINGQPSYVLTTENDERYAVLCDDLLVIDDGSAITLLGTLTGEIHTTHGCPALTLAAYVP